MSASANRLSLTSADETQRVAQAPDGVQYYGRCSTSRSKRGSSSNCIRWMTASPALDLPGPGSCSGSDPWTCPAPVDVPVVILAVDDDPPDDPEAQGEEGQVPPWVIVAHRQERPDRAEAAANNPD